MKFLGFLFLVGVAGAIGLGVYVLTGFYSIAATEPHAAVLEWLAHESMEASVARHARSIEVPPLDGEARLDAGFEEYTEMCEVCHSAPGVEPTSIARGLYPEPPELADEAEEWTPAELFWLVKHGAKDTGMPAFGPTHDDDTLWSIVAFTQQLPRMSAQDYAARRERLAAEGHSHSHGSASEPGAAPDAASGADAKAAGEDGEDGEDESHSHEDGVPHSHD